jgi:hypothetical protein
MISNISYLEDHSQSYYSEAAGRTLRQFISAFWFEGTLRGHVERCIDGNTNLYLQGKMNRDNDTLIAYRLIRQTASDVTAYTVQSSTLRVD